MSPQLDPISAAMLLVAMYAELEPLVRRLGIDHPETHKPAVAFFENLEREHDRAVLAQALQKRDLLLPRDIEQLLELRTLTPADRNLLSQLCMDKKRRSGRPVLSQDPPKTFAQAFADAWSLGNKLWNPDTPAHERRIIYSETSLWGRYIEAAYRGELKAAKRRKVRAFEVAEENVAKAAVISRALVRSICVQERQKLKAALPNAVADEAMTAKQLKSHLETGPDEMIARKA
jgi:hypothetical protein